MVSSSLTDFAKINERGFWRATLKTLITDLGAVEQRGIMWKNGE